MEKRKIAGIIGGMGPEATVDLMRRVIRATPARDDEDHVHMLVDNNPHVPSRIRALLDKTGESPVPCLRGMARGLEAAGADFLAIPCNTAHVYYDEIASAVSIPVLHMLRLTAQSVLADRPEPGKVGILASDAVQQTALYEDCFRESGVSVLYPHEEIQHRIMAAIRAVKAGTRGAVEEAALRDAAQDLLGQGAEAFVVACTELSMVSETLTGIERVYDAAQILAEAIVGAAGGFDVDGRG